MKRCFDGLFLGRTESVCFTTGRNSSLFWGWRWFPLGPQEKRNQNFCFDRTGFTNIWSVSSKLPLGFVLFEAQSARYSSFQTNTQFCSSRLIRQSEKANYEPTKLELVSFWCHLICKSILWLVASHEFSAQTAFWKTEKPNIYFRLEGFVQSEQ